ncbi:uncharacterized protein LOC127591652 [Hippocampus zosterae]|uniref:uncharacterized protein LOC127591652 n=1 Tax=Hippocampus zosterae TaxID=109293 RepID=UPI00223DE848|nr:uncharacterized protein LOC127591652 [Hippocampus zosterae]
MSLPESSESDSATGLTSDLYIFENETQDFILSSTASQNNHDASPLACCHSAKRVTHSTGMTMDWAMLESESGLTPPAEVTRVKPRGPRSLSPAEPWADACQYLDRTDVLPTSTSSVFPLEEIWVSGYASDGIGWDTDDTRGWGPPVERWSSVESWASALSDWNVIGTPRQELTTAFSEIGAEVDALTEALVDIKPYSETEKGMGVHDQLVGQTIQEESVHCGQECFSFLPQVGDNGQSFGNSTPNTQSEPEEIAVMNFVHENQSLVPSACDLDSLIPVWTPIEDVDIPQCVRRSEREDLKEEKNALNIVEDADVTGQPSEWTNEQLSGDGLFKVIEDHRASQPEISSNQSADASAGPNIIDCNGRETSEEDTMNPRVPVFNNSGHTAPDILTDTGGATQVCPGVSSEQLGWRSHEDFQ